MSTAESTLYTPDDLLTMPGGERFELVDGRLLETDMGAEADWISTRIKKLLAIHVDANHLGYVFGPETGYQCFPDDPMKVRKPDGSFVAAGRLPGGRIPRGHIRIAPDLAVEVISPNDSYYGVEAKIHEYRDAGVRLIWIVNPENRTVRVDVTADGRQFELSVGDELDGSVVLPDFRCQVAELFPEFDSLSAEASRN